MSNSVSEYGGIARSGIGIEVEAAFGIGDEIRDLHPGRGRFSGWGKGQAYVPGLESRLGFGIEGLGRVQFWDEVEVGFWDQGQGQVSMPRSRSGSGFGIEVKFGFLDWRFPCWGQGRVSGRGLGSNFGIGVGIEF
ncbi:hypothetical protein TIFTF001_016652 [Ficus carica]|uniref:Uncharacterized protein n=1 Tax=Ficus carica TaxID=3494 RepID=A0AA88DIW1_FICCA|nr:hypothetical protein TIFTF001_016652 [Ficus carica]